MAEQVYIRDIANFVGQEITIKGWLYNKRDKGRLQFLLVRDGTGIIQAVAFEKELSPEAFGAARDSHPRILGHRHRHRCAPIAAPPAAMSCRSAICRSCSWRRTIPSRPKSTASTFLMDNRHLWLRSSQQWAILRVRATVIRAIRDWLDNHGFLLVDTPILTPAACEGTTTLFETEYFGEKAYLTQSGQLYNEATIVAFGRTYCFGPTFRAEKSKTRRHLIEFWMVEPEMAYADLDECMRVEEEFVSYIVQRALEERAEELKILERDTTALQTIRRPSRASATTMRSDVLQEGGRRAALGRGFRRAPRDDPRLHGRPARLCASLSGPGQGLLHGGRPRASRAFPLGGPAGPGGLRRDHRRRPAHGQPGAAGAAHRGAQPAARGLSSGTWTCAAMAPCRTRALAWASSAPSPGSAACSTSARRSPSRAPWGACIPRLEPVGARR